MADRVTICVECAYHLKPSAWMPGMHTEQNFCKCPDVAETVNFVTGEPGTPCRLVNDGHCKHYMDMTGPD